MKNTGSLKLELENTSLAEGRDIEMAGDCGY